MSTRSTSLLAVMVAALSWPGAPTGALQQAPRFRASVEAVVLDVSVLGRDGLPVRGLEARDFTVLEDGTPQSITTFTPIDLPDVERAIPGWQRDAPRDTAANDQFMQGAVLVILMDDIAGTIPSLLQDCARQVIGSMGPHDVAAVVYLAGKYLGQGFTSDRSRLLAAVERYMGSGGSALSALAPRMLADTIDDLADGLAALPSRRKAIVCVSSGLSFRARILDAQNAAVLDADRTLAAALFEGHRSADYYLDLPVANLEAGPYPLTLEATMGKRREQRDVRFTVLDKR